MFSMFCFQRAREAAADLEVTHISQVAKCPMWSLSEWPEHSRD